MKLYKIETEKQNTFQSQSFYCVCDTLIDAADYIEKLVKLGYIFKTLHYIGEQEVSGCFKVGK